MLIMHWADLISNVLLIATACVVAYVLLLHKIEKIISERNLQTADQLASLDNAIRALETRLSEHHAASELIEATLGMDADASEPEVLQKETQTGQVAPEYHP
jgi:hypothetical protein